MADTPRPDARGPRSNGAAVPQFSREQGPARTEWLLENIDPQPVGDDRFVIGPSQEEAGHLFGGLVAAQSLRAAAKTVSGERRADSVHAYFLRAGRPDLPIEFEVHRDTDGRSFSARRVAASQEGKPIFTMICSFHVPEDIDEHLQSLPPGLPRPDDLDPDPESGQGSGAFDLRVIHPEGHDPDSFWLPDRYWVRTYGTVPDDPIVHDCLLLFASDIGTPWPKFVTERGHLGPSLDHALWFHRRTRVDQWIFMEMDIGAATDARGLYTGRMWDVTGVQVATLAQQNLIRRQSWP